MQNISQHIFREYDIRGKESDDELNPNSMELIGRAYGTYCARNNIKTVVVGGDNRGTSEEFKAAAIRGLLSTGRKIIDIGTVLTPMMYWAQYHFETEGGFMVTASHNPLGWNGAKLGDGYSNTLGGEKLQELYKLIKNSDFYEPESPGTEDDIKKEDIKDEYIKDLTERVDLKKEFKVVVNTGNGTASLVLPDLLRAAGCEVIEHLTDPDPAYPNYTPNPADVEMMEDTARVVKENNADLGLAFDGDGDRVGLCDENGEIVFPDRYMIFLSRLVLENKPGAKIIFDVKCSQALEEDIEKHGGKPVMAKTGHSFIKKALKEEKAELAGELSGHVFFQYNYYGFDDASFASLNLLQYFSDKDKPVSELVEDTPYYISTPGYNAPTADDKKHDVVDELAENFKSDGYEVIDIDGARVVFENGWGLVRASNTSPNLVLRFEAKTREDLEEIEKEFRRRLGKYEFIGGEWETG